MSTSVKSFVSLSPRDAGITRRVRGGGLVWQSLVVMGPFVWAEPRERRALLGYRRKYVTSSFKTRSLSARQKLPLGGRGGSGGTIAEQP